MTDELSGARKVLELKLRQRKEAGQAVEKAPFGNRELFRYRQLVPFFLDWLTREYGEWFAFEPDFANLRNWAESNFPDETENPREYAAFMAKVQSFLDTNEYWNYWQPVYEEKLIKRQETQPQLFRQTQLIPQFLDWLQTSKGEAETFKPEYALLQRVAQGKALTNIEESQLFDFFETDSGWATWFPEYEKQVEERRKLKPAFDQWLDMAFGSGTSKMTEFKNVDTLGDDPYWKYWQQNAQTSLPTHKYDESGKQVNVGNWQFVGSGDITDDLGKRRVINVFVPVADDWKKIDQNYLRQQYDNGLYAVYADTGQVALLKDPNTGELRQTLSPYYLSDMGIELYSQDDDSGVANQIIRKAFINMMAKQGISEAEMAKNPRLDSVAQKWMSGKLGDTLTPEIETEFQKEFSEARSKLPVEVEFGMLEAFQRQQDVSVQPELTSPKQRIVLPGEAVTSEDDIVIADSVDEARARGASQWIPAGEWYGSGRHVLATQQADWLRKTQTGKGKVPYDLYAKYMTDLESSGRDVALQNYKDALKGLTTTGDVNDYITQTARLLAMQGGEYLAGTPAGEAPTAPTPTTVGQISASPTGFQSVTSLQAEQREKATKDAERLAWEDLARRAREVGRRPERVAKI